MAICHAVHPVAYNSWLFPVLSFADSNNFCLWWWSGKLAFIMILGGQFLSLLGQTTPGTLQASLLSLCDSLVPLHFTDTNYSINLCLNFLFTSTLCILHEPFVVLYALFPLWKAFGSCQLGGVGKDDGDTWDSSPNCVEDRALFRAQTDYEIISS